MNIGISILLAFLLDIILGDPRRPTHPVVLIGRFISFLENCLRTVFKTSKGLKAAGIILWVIVVFTVYFATFFIIKTASNFNWFLGQIINIWLLYTAFALKNLSEEAFKIFEELKKNNIESARKRLSFIVGRDTVNLDSREICRAVVETVAENTMDGIISPLFYAFIGGAPLTLAYKAINTLDSMVGYKNERYKDLGWFSAKMDDIANFIPARIGGLLMLLASSFMRLNTRGGLKTLISDAKKHESPNSGIPEAITAGVLGIRLGGYNSYGGVMSFREYMGENFREIVLEDIKTTVKLSILTSILGLIIGEVFRCAIL